MRCRTEQMLVVPPGSDWLDRIVLRDEAGPVDLTGWTAEVRDLTGDLPGAMAAGIVAGTVELSLTWQLAWPLTQALLGTFRLAVENGAMERVTVPHQVWVDGREQDRIILGRGSDLDRQFIWDNDRLGADLTGDTIEVINVSPALSGLVTAEIVDAASRRVAFHVEGDPATPLGDLGTFQLRRSTGGLHRRTTLPFRIIST